MYSWHIVSEVFILHHLVVSSSWGCHELEYHRGEPVVSYLPQLLGVSEEEGRWGQNIVLRACSQGSSSVN